MAEIEVPVELVPVKTRILTDKDDIVDVIEEYAKHVVGPDDLVCTAESVVAITQHRYTRPEELTPSWQARLMRRFVPGEGSMASLYGMQAAMNLEGEWKMLFWFIVGFFAKLAGKNGVWYAKCRQASLTDDVTGTMPPFDKCIVYGPAEPDKVAEKSNSAWAATVPSSLTSTTSSARLSSATARASIRRKSLGSSSTIPLAMRPKRRRLSSLKITQKCLKNKTG